MADDELLVTISGPAFSLLLYENRRIVDQMGFLLGEILVYVTKKVTDVEREIEHTKYHIDIKSIVAYPVGEPFFNGIGRIDREKLDNVLGNSAKNVVGWYHFREEFPTMKQSFRDTNIHKELAHFFPRKNDLLAPENFLFLKLTSSVSEMGGTHKFKHLLLRKQTFAFNAAFKPLSLKISNLGADASRADGSDYKPRPTHSSNYDTFNNVYNHIRKDLKNVSGVKAVTMIQDAADNLLEELIPKISESDQQVSELENRLMILRDEYFRRLDTQRQLQEKMENMEVDCKFDTPSQPKSPETLELLDIEKSPEPNVSNVKQTVIGFEKLGQRQRRSSTERDFAFARGSRDNLSDNTEQSKSKKPTCEFIRDSSRFRSSHSNIKLRLSPDGDDDDT